MACRSRSLYHGRELPHLFTSTYRLRRQSPSREVDLIELGWRVAVVLTGPADADRWSEWKVCSWCGTKRDSEGPSR